VAKVGEHERAVMPDHKAMEKLKSREKCLDIDSSCGSREVDNECAQAGRLLPEAECLRQEWTPTLG
jgi:hypothetical protein